jgi:4-amino-4-deoxy-L-arabinose transferase-like glycosyltransferase
MHQEFEHDEHQFVAAAVLLVKHHLVPYGDFPFFHAPNVLFVYAVLSSLTSQLLLSVRLFSAACAALSIFLIFMTALRLGRGPRNFTSLLVGVSAALLLVTQPLFLYTSGRA